jgi:hypothetical protein
MLFEVGHPCVARSDWEQFRKQLPLGLIQDVIDRSEIKLPDWFVPLAPGIAIASDLLLLKCNDFHQSERPCGWRKSAPRSFLKRDIKGMDGAASLNVRRYAHQRWWTIERWRDDRERFDVSDVLAFVFGSTPIFSWSRPVAMRIAEYCHIKGPPPGLKWIVACPVDEVGAINLALQRQSEGAVHEDNFVAARNLH